MPMPAPSGTLQEYQKRMKKLDQQYRERIRNAELFLQLETEQVERNYIKEKKAAVKEFEDKKVELKENLIAELEEKKKMIENEKLTMELTGGTEAGPCELSRHSSHARGRAGELASRPTPQQLGA